MGPDIFEAPVNPKFAWLGERNSDLDWTEPLATGYYDKLKSRKDWIRRTKQYQLESRINDSNDTNNNNDLPLGAATDNNNNNNNNNRIDSSTLSNNNSNTSPTKRASTSNHNYITSPRRIRVNESNDPDNNNVSPFQRAAPIPDIASITDAAKIQSLESEVQYLKQQNHLIQQELKQAQETIESKNLIIQQSQEIVSFLRSNNNNSSGSRNNNNNNNNNNGIYYNNNNNNNSSIYNQFSPFNSNISNNTISNNTTPFNPNNPQH